MNNLTKITNALSNLLTRTNSDAFVIIQHQATQKFVQFAIAEQRKLLLDLPAQTLSETEFYRAVSFFQKRGVSGEEYPLLDQPGGQVAAMQFTFNMTFTHVDDAAETAHKVLGEIYGFPADCEINIIEN